MKFYSCFDTPFCEVILAGDKTGVSHLYLNTGEGKRDFSPQPDWVHNRDIFAGSEAQVREYFNGRLKRFNIRLIHEGTEFQKSVWNILSDIPYGQLRSYKDIAVTMGNKNASRAVGGAIGKNPLPLIIPCHRVIGSSGSITGFAHGVRIKKDLINLEKT